MFDLIKQIGELIEPYRASVSELYDIQILKKLVHGYHAAFSFLPKIAAESESNATLFL